MAQFGDGNNIMSSVRSGWKRRKIYRTETENRKMEIEKYLSAVNRMNNSRTSFVYRVYRKRNSKRVNMNEKKWFRVLANSDGARHPINFC